jgi:hypothetical protein
VQLVDCKTRQITAEDWIPQDIPIEIITHRDFGAGEN